MPLFNYVVQLSGFSLMADHTKVGSFAAENCLQNTKQDLCKANDLSFL